MEMPDQVGRQWGNTPDAVSRHVIEDAAIEGYRAGRLTQRQVGAMPGLDYWQTEAFLNERAVKLNYSAAELDADSATLKKNSRPHMSVVVSDTSLLRDVNPA